MLKCFSVFFKNLFLVFSLLKIYICSVWTDDGMEDGTDGKLHFISTSMDGWWDGWRDGWLDGFRGSFCLPLLYVLNGFPMVPNYAQSVFCTSCHLFQKLFIIASHFIPYPLHIRCLKENLFFGCMGQSKRSIIKKRGNPFGCNPQRSHPQQVTNALLLPWQLQH